MVAKTVEELRGKNNKMESLRAKDKRAVAAMGRALTESKRTVKEVSVSMKKQQIEYKEEVKKVSAVLDDTRTSLESVKKVRFYLSYIKFLHNLFSCSLAPTEGKVLGPMKNTMEKLIF